MDDIAVCFTCPREIRIVHMIKLHVFTFLDPCYDVRYTICIECDARCVFAPICYVGSSCYISVSCVYLRMLVPNTISISEEFDDTKGGNQNLYIEEEQTMQLPKRNSTKGQTTIYKTYT